MINSCLFLMMEFFRFTINRSHPAVAFLLFVSIFEAYKPTAEAVGGLFLKFSMTIKQVGVNLLAGSIIGHNRYVVILSSHINVWAS